MTPTEAPSVLVVGAGSIGARHARNLAAAGAAVTITDPDEGRARDAAAACGGEAAALDLASLPRGRFDAAVVASPSSLHVHQADALLDAVDKVLVEKPIGLDAASAHHLAAHADRVAVGYNLRFHAPLEQVAALIADGRAGHVLSIDLWFGSWLPDWRPAVDYRTTYSARSELGGGILLDAIHELDVLIWLAGTGPHQVVGAACEQSGALELDVEDSVKAIVRCAGGELATISLDYLARRYRRGVQVTGDQATVRLDWARKVVEVEDADRIDSHPVEVPLDRAYERQAAAFVAWVQGGPGLPVDAATGLASLALADQIREAAR